jgi:sarcosine oxidase
VLFQPDSGVCLAGRTVAALQRLAERDGVPLRAHTPVLGIEARGDRALLRTPAGELSAKVAVIAAGPWSERLLTGAVARAPRLTVTLQQVRYFRPNDAGAGAWPTWIEWSDVELIWYAVPMVGDAPGVKVAAHIPGRAVDPADGPFDQIDPAEDGRAAEYVRARLPGLEPARLGPETCLYTMTADEDFVLDREGPVVVGAGCSGHAFKFGPLLGEMMADLALGRDTGAGTTRFSLARPALATVPRI